CNVESWRLADIKRDNYPPNSQGVKMWESDKRKAQANMLLDLVKQADAMDAQALVFMEKSFPQMFVRLDAEEVLAQLTRELSRVSNKCIATLLSMSWSPVQRKLISKALPSPRRYAAILKAGQGWQTRAPDPFPVPCLARLDWGAGGVRLAGGVCRAGQAGRQCVEWRVRQASASFTRVRVKHESSGSCVQEIEGASAASSHPGDWRYRNFDYE
ncbi:hypothetical protein QJQ45_017245, partial [Haematococcus lacustris]